MLFMPFKANISVYSKKTFDAFRELRRGPEEYTDVVQRLVDEHFELIALKMLLSPKQLAELEARARKQERKSMEVLAR